MSECEWCFAAKEPHEARFIVHGETALLRLCWCCWFKAAFGVGGAAASKRRLVDCAGAAPDLYREYVLSERYYTDVCAARVRKIIGLQS